MILVCEKSYAFRDAIKMVHISHHLADSVLSAIANLISGSQSTKNYLGNDLCRYLDNAIQ